MGYPVVASAKILTQFLKSPVAPHRLRPLTLFVMASLAAGLLFGPDSPASLFLALVWLLWWPMIIFLFLFAGRIWCGMCPFTLLGDWLQRATGLRRAVPEFLKEHGGWLTLIMFFWLIWMEEISNAPDSPRSTAVVILTIASGAMFFGLFFRGHSWCRYMCPLGGVSLAYARTSLFKIRNSESACGECLTKACVVVDAEYAGCPMHITPFAMNMISNCKLCGTCVQRCSNDSLHMTLEAPSRDLTSQSQITPVVSWFIILLAGMVSFLNATRTPFFSNIAAWLHSSAHPIFIKTTMMAAALTAMALLFKVFIRLANDPAKQTAPEQLVALSTLPLIPLLLLTHLGYFMARTLAKGGLIATPLADFIGIRWLRLDFLWGAGWTGYVAPLFIFLGLAVSIYVLRWITAMESGLNHRRIQLVIGLLYSALAGWNLLLTWPAAFAPATIAPEIPVRPLDGSTILWLFLGVNAISITLAMIVRRTVEQSGAAEAPADFSASHSWKILRSAKVRQMEYYDWLLEQAMEARLRMPAVTALANACQEIISFLQQALPASSTITIKAVLRKNKGILTIIHEGRPLALPDYKAASSLDAADENSLDGLELRLAAAYVEHMSYSARISDSTCSFTLRQSC
jgi:polyferredoxin